MDTGNLELWLDVVRGMLPNDPGSNVKLDDARRLQAGKVPRGADPASAGFLAVVGVPWKDGDSANDEDGANSQQGRQPSHRCHVNLSSEVFAFQYIRGPTLLL